MRKILLGLALLLAVSPFCFGQGFSVGHGFPISAALNTPGVISTVPGSLISICAHPANGVPCTNKATTYTSITLGTPCSTSTQLVLAGTSTCVANTDPHGNWGAWVAHGTYDFTIELATGQSYGPYTISAGITTGSSFSSGALTTNGPNTLGGATNSNGMLNATFFTGADINAQANAAFASCSNVCTVYIPAGVYTSVTTLSFPLNTNGRSELTIAPGAVINYTGTGYAISAIGAGQSNANVIIDGGGRVNGTSSGLGGVHLEAFNRAEIYNLQVTGFTAGDGFFNQGANGIDCYACQSSGNLNGVHNVGVVVSSVNYAANAIHWHGGQIASNTGWGWFEDGTQSGAVGPNVADGSEGTVYDFNGTNGSATSGQIFLERCDACDFSNHNFFEYVSGTSPTSSIVLGDATTNCGGANLCIANNPVIRGNWFGSVGSTNTISDVNSFGAIVDGNWEAAAVTNFYNHGTLSRSTVIGRNSAKAATNYLAGSDSGSDTVCLAGSSAAAFLNCSYGTTNGYTFNNLVENHALLATGTQNISGCALSGAAGGAAAGSFTAGATSCTVTITPGNTAPHGFACSATDLTTAADTIKQSGKLSTTTCTLRGTVARRDLITWTATAF
jgi:hypothetical protein